MNDSTQTIKKSAACFFSGTLLSRISGLIRDMSMAYMFGTKASVASFFLAFRLAHLMRRLFGEGPLQSAFIPEFESLRLKDEKKAYGFFCSLTLGITLLLIFLIGLSMLILGSMLYWGNISSTNYEVIFLTILMLPSLLFICLYGINASLLQCNRYYFMSSVAPVAFNLVWILSIWGLASFPTQQAMPYLAIGVCFACFCQWILTVPKTFFFLKKAQVSDIIKDAFDNIQHVLFLVKPLFLGVLGVAASQINNLMDTLFGRYASLEGPAILWYSIRLQQLPLALFGIAIAGAILPPLSRAIKSNNHENFQHFLSYGLLTTLFFMLPITGMIFCMGDTGINLIYGRGDFDAHAIRQTTYCLWGYGIGLIPSALILILAPAYYAQSNYTLPAIISCISMLTNLFLNSFFIFFLNWNVASVALATSLSAWINVFILYKKTKQGILFRNVFIIIAKLFLCTCIASYSVVVSRELIEGFSFNFQLLINWPQTIIEQLINLSYQLTLFITIWILSGLCFDLPLKETFNINFIFKKQEIYAD